MRRGAARRAAFPVRDCGTLRQSSDDKARRPKDAPREGGRSQPGFRHSRRTQGTPDSCRTRALGFAVFRSGFVGLNRIAVREGVVCRVAHVEQTDDAEEHRHRHELVVCATNGPTRGLSISAFGMRCGPRRIARRTLQPTTAAGSKRHRCWRRRRRRRRRHDTQQGHGYRKAAPAQTGRGEPSPGADVAAVG